MSLLKEIKITEIGDFRIGNVEDKENGTGVTVIISKDGMKAGVDIRGGGPASRETPLLNPLMNPEKLNALVFSGGSAFGLNASAGVVKYLEEKNIGYYTKFANVPLICQSCIYDLGYKSSKVRPDEKMGYDACIDSEKNIPREGNVGVGCGATVGKLYGMEQAQKSGLGIYAIQIQDLKVGAIVVVNALGDVFNGKNEKIAGLTSKDKKTFLNFREEMYKSLNPITNEASENTTLAAIITNGKFSKAHLCKIASMAQDALARRIDPVHTMHDGDTVYVLSTDQIEANINIVGTLATQVLETAIERAVTLSKQEMNNKLKEFN
jgi:L-aminopeptidase/D-esterase-like protein